MTTLENVMKNIQLIILVTKTNSFKYLLDINELFIFNIFSEYISLSYPKYLQNKYFSVCCMSNILLRILYKLFHFTCNHIKYYYNYLYLIHDENKAKRLQNLLYI